MEFFEVVRVIALIVACGLAFYGLVRLITDRKSVEKDAAILWAIDRSAPDGLTVFQICKFTGVPRTDVYTRIQRLEEQGTIRATINTKRPGGYRYHMTLPTEK